MEQVHRDPTQRKGLWITLAVAVATGAGAITIAFPPASANADPAPPAPGTNEAPPPPADPNAPPPPPADPNAPPVPEPGRVDNAVGGFSFVIPPGWVESDASQLNYGSALLSKEAGPAEPGQPPPVANDTRILLGRLDQKLYAGAEPNDTKAAARLSSDMGEFYLPYPGTRIDQETIPLKGNGLPGSASYYAVKFADAAKPNGQIWAGVVGPPAQTTPGGPPERWFAVWLGTANDPVDKVAAATLAESIRPWTPPPAPEAPAPPPAPGAPPPAPPPAPGAPAPGAPAPGAPAPGAPAPAPAPAPPPPGQAPAGMPAAAAAEPTTSA